MVPSNSKYVDRNIVNAIRRGIPCDVYRLELSLHISYVILLGSPVDKIITTGFYHQKKSKAMRMK